QMLLERRARHVRHRRAHEGCIKAPGPDLADRGRRGIGLGDGASLGLEALYQLRPKGRGFVNDENMRHGLLPALDTTSHIVIAACGLGCKTRSTELPIPIDEAEIGEILAARWPGGAAPRASRRRPRRRSRSQRGSGSSATSARKRSTARIYRKIFGFVRS